MNPPSTSATRKRKLTDMRLLGEIGTVMHRAEPTIISQSHPPLLHSLSLNKWTADSSQGGLSLDTGVERGWSVRRGSTAVECRMRTKYVGGGAQFVRKEVRK